MLLVRILCLVLLFSSLGSRFKVGFRGIVRLEREVDADVDPTVDSEKVSMVV